MEGRNFRIPDSKHEVQPAYELAVVERYRFEVRVHGVQQLETAATSALAHVQQFAVA